MVNFPSNINVRLKENMNAFDVVFILLIALILLVLLGFTVRVVGGVFSTKIRKKIRTHPFLHFLWFLLCMGIIYLVIPVNFPWQPPKDAKMVDHFHTYKSELKILVTMLREDDKIKYLTDSFIEPEGIVEEKRWDQYRNLMASIGVGSIYIYRDFPPEIKFCLFNGGGPLGGFSKGYAYSTREPGPIKDNLDRSRSDLPPYSSFFKKVQGDWYIYIERHTD
jgi:hypothetical protein